MQSLIIIIIIIIMIAITIIITIIMIITIIDVAIPVDGRVGETEDEKVEKYQVKILQEPFEKCGM